MKTSPCLLLALPLLVSACSKDSPVGPASTTPPATTATAVIGTSGGTLRCEGFSIKVPASAFSRTETLTVTRETYSGFFGSLNLGDEFRLDGLPADFAGQLQLSLKCTRTPSTGLFVGVGYQAVDHGNGEPRRLYDVLPAVPDSGALAVTFGPGNLTPSSGKLARALGDAAEMARWFCAFDQLDTLKSSQGHFKVIHPKSSVGMATAVAGNLEDAYAWFDQNGFNRGTYALARWPMKVLVAESKGFLPNELVSTNFFWNNADRHDTPAVVLCCNEGEWDWGEPEFRKWLFAGFSLLFCSVQDDFFHWLSKYDRILEEPDASHLWPYFAIANWAGGNSHRLGYDSLPPRLTGKLLKPLRGLPLPASTHPVGHGYGMSGLMKHIADTYGVQTLADIYHALPTATSEIDVLLEKIPEPEYVWWPAFLKRYLAGEIYGVPADTLLRDLEAGPGSREFAITARWDTLKSFSDQFRDLSARLYRVNLEYPNFAPNATITFEIGPSSLNMNYVHVMLFGLKNQKLEYWETANKVKVELLKDLTVAGYDIVAAVVNSANEDPYTGSLGIDLTVTVQADVITLGRIMVRTTGTTRYNDGTSSTASMVLYNYDKTFRQGTLREGLFTATWDEGTPAKRNAGAWTILADFSVNPAKVTYFKAEETTSASYETETWKVEASSTCAIPGAKDQLGRYVFFVQGTDVSKHILPVVNRYVGTGGYWRELSETKFDGDSYIEIIFE